MSAVPAPVPAPHSAPPDTSNVSPTGVGPAIVADGVELASANAGELSLIHALLLAANQGPSRNEFLAAQEDPYYEPSDHLLGWFQGVVVSHVLLRKRVMNFGEVQLPAAEVQWLATLPEYRSRGYASRLLQIADDRMREDGAVLALLRTRNPEIFAHLGWLACGQPAHVRVSARQLLAQLGAQSLLADPPRFTTRMWRQVELRALVDIYDRNTRGAYGPLQRSEEYWRWLITRRAYDEIIVAIEGEDNWEFGEQAPRIAGYAVTRQDQIVELFTDPAYPTAAAELLARACGEAIERDYHTLCVHAPAHQVAMSWILGAGGGACEPPGAAGEVLMMKVLDVEGLLARLFPELQARARESHVPRPVYFQLDLAGEPYRLTLSQRSVRFGPEASARCDMNCTPAQWESLILSQLAFEGAIEAGALRVRTKVVQKTLRALFPHLPLWRAGLDDLAA